MKILLPGDVIGKGVRVEKGISWEENGITYASVVGMITNKNFVALEHVYIPKPGHPIVGIIKGEKRPVGYLVDTNTYYQGLILSRETRVKFKIGTQIFAKVARIEESGTIVLGEVKKLPNGKIVDVPASKIPRIIGKNASMIKTIKKYTNTKLYVGSNGYIWIGKEGDVALAVKAIKQIVSKAHLKGLTDEITEMLKKEGKHE